MSKDLDAIKSLNRAAKSDILRDAADLVEIQRQARGRLLNDWSARTAPKQAEPEEPKKTKPAAKRRAH